MQRLAALMVPVACYVDRVAEEAEPDALRAARPVAGAGPATDHPELLRGHKVYAARSTGLSRGRPL